MCVTQNYHDMKYHFLRWQNQSGQVILAEICDSAGFPRYVEYKFVKQMFVSYS